MHRWIAIFSFTVLYYALTGYALYVFDAGLVTTGLFLYGIPAILLAHYSHAPTPIILSVAALGFGLGLILESAAHLYGLWYTLGANETRLFGLVATEMLLVTTMQAVFLALLYEMFFDDGQYTPSSGRTRMAAFFVFATAAFVFLFIYQTWFAHLFLEYSFVWLVVVLTAGVLAALGVYRAYSIRFFDRLIWFAAVASVPGTIALTLAVTNTHKIFANPEQYLFAITMFGEMVALEELLLIVGTPFLIGVLYELYLDDQS